MAGRKSTKIVVQQRVKIVLELYLKGYSYSQIHHYTTEKKWGLHSRSIDAYIAKAKNIMSENCKQSITEMTEKIINCQWHLYKDCVETKNASIARLLLVDIGKITGAIATNSPLKNVDELRTELSNKELEEKLKNAG